MNTKAKDYKKEFKNLYSPKTTPEIVNVQEMQFVAVEGKGNPNDKNGEYQKAIEILYSVQYTIKMSKMNKNSEYIPENYFDYVVPPLEGFWWLDNSKINSEDFSDKSKYCWISLIRLPEFVDKKVFDWACDEVTKKKNIDTKNAKFLSINEGLCVQCMHIGAYDDETKTLKLMENFLAENNLKKDLNETRRHHEIYLNDPRKTEIAKLKTILRLPVKRLEC